MALPASEAKVPIGLATALRQRGLALAEIESLAGLTPGALDAEPLRLPVPRDFALWSAIRQVSARPSIGIELAQSVRFDLTEPLFLAIVSAATALDALQVLASYKRVLSPEALSLTRSDGVIRLDYEWPAEPPDVLVDVELAFVVVLCRHATGRPSLTPQRVRLRRARLEDETAWRAFFGCPVSMSSAENAISFDASLGDLPLWTSNPELTEALATHLGMSRGATSAIARARAAIARRLSGTKPSLAGVARELAMSTRSLQRILREGDTSFRALLDAVRYERALTHLRSSSHTDAEIAFLLGFEDPGSFQRAFRSWSGTSTGEARASGAPVRLAGSAGHVAHLAGEPGVEIPRRHETNLRSQARPERRRHR